MSGTCYNCNSMVREDKVFFCIKKKKSVRPSGTCPDFVLFVPKWGKKKEAE